jgi:hypothetical protein
MNDPLYLQAEFRTSNEPMVHPLVKNSFVFVPSAGARYAPEELILELMREIFFAQYSESTADRRDIKPEDKDENNNYLFTINERAVLHILRGRRKKSKNSIPRRSFAPAYPQLVKANWFGKKRERVVNKFLLSGPISQHFWSRGSTEEGKKRQLEFVEKLTRALLGYNSCFDENLQGKEILAATLGPENFRITNELAFSNLIVKTGISDSVLRIDNDVLAHRITQDLISLCDLESHLPRMQWLQLLMTFLRFALPMWLLAQIQITGLLHSWLIAAVDNGKLSESGTVLVSLARRNCGLLHPTLTPTRELFEHIECYMKHRVELDILLYCLELVRGEQIKGKELSIENGGQNHIGIDQLLILARDASFDIRSTVRFKQVADGYDIQTFLTRESEQFAAWRNPLMRGQGKNIDEFFRVLYRAELGDEAGGYLLTPEGRGVKRGFMVFPGQMLLKTITYLAAQSKWASQRCGGAGMLVLQDVEDHFGQYGIDFSTAADARPLLMKDLQAMGLLTGSPDAGSSVAVACPYPTQDGSN